MIFKKITAAVSALVMAAGMVSVLPQNSSPVLTANAASAYNYAEALQKSMFFYEVQQSGVLPEWNTVQWKDDCMVDEDGKETDYVKGGWFDAGDHFKFCLTNAYSASMLAWGYLEYKDAVDNAGMGELYRNNLQWGLDYVMNCDMGNGKMVGTIGDFKGGSTDHNIWCSSEVYLRKHHLNNGDWKRPYDVIENASVAGLSAAALAEGYLVFKDTDPDRANEYLKHAKSLFKGADQIRDCSDIGGMTGMYKTESWVDDCMFAALWLYKATGDKSYLNKVEQDYIPLFPKEEQDTARKFTWGLCWDDTSQGAAFLYAQITGNKEWTAHVKRHLTYWMGEDSKPFFGKITPKGLSWLFQWGCLRHATTTAFLAKLGSDTLFKGTDVENKFSKWGDLQMNYCFGDNEMGYSYVLGMGDKSPTAIHHRTASGVHDDHWNELGQESGGNEGWQTEYAHTLYGALIGGPDSSGDYGDYKVADFQYTEVAIDYNAGYTACLCAMIDDYGGKPLNNFPVKETPKWAEWEVAAVLNGKGNSYSEIKAWAMNHTAWPARVAKDIEYRYFFDASEIFDAGLTIDDIKVISNSQQYKEGEQGYGTVSGPYVYEGDKSGKTLYAKVKFEDGRAIQPTGQSEHRDEVQFRISIPDAINGKSTAGAWDPTNDWSYKGGLATASDIKSDSALNKNIPMYVNGVLVWGTEPDGTTATGSEYKFKRNGGESSSTISNPTVKCDSVTTSSAKISWNKVSGVSKYGVYIYKNGKWTGLAETTANSYTVSGLAAGTSYKVAVLANNNGKYDGDYSKAITVTTQKSSTQTTDYPTNVKANYNTQYHQVQFVWDKVQGADKYGIAVYLAGKWRVQTSNVTTNSYVTPKNLTPGMTYKVAVAARVNGKWNTTDPIKNAITVTVK